MRGVRTVLAVLGACAACAGPARAGVYISTEQLPTPTTLNGDNGVRPFRLVLQSIANQQKTAPDSERSKYQRQVARLKERVEAGTATALDRTDLGGCYLRLNQPDDAVRAYRSAGDDNFLALTGLAVAYQSIGLLDRAVLAQKQALDRWPPVWAGWPPGRWYTNRRAEHAFYNLLAARAREAARADGRSGPVQAVDELFPGVRYGGPGGDYAAGRVDPAVLDRIPADALWVVRDLIWSMPSDDRLYWQFGELLNARGEVENALTVFNDLVSVREWSNVRELMRHRQILRERAALLEALRRSPMVDGGRNPLPPLVQESLLWALAPRGCSGVPGAGPPAYEAAWWATAGCVEILQEQERAGRPVSVADLSAASSASPAGSGLAAESPATTPPAALPDWRPLAVGFVAGLVVAAVVGLQVAEWRRRKAARQRV